MYNKCIPTKFLCFRFRRIPYGGIANAKIALRNVVNYKLHGNKVYRLKVAKIVRSKTNSTFQAKALRQEVSNGEDIVTE